MASHPKSEWERLKDDTHLIACITKYWIVSQSWQWKIILFLHPNRLFKCTQHNNINHLATINLNSLNFFFFFFTLGIDEYRVSVVDASPLPEPRLITSTVHRDVDRPDNDLSILIMSWGQFIDHDLTLAAPPRGRKKYC